MRFLTQINIVSMKKTTLLLAVAALGCSLLAVAARGAFRKDAPGQSVVSAMGFLIDDETRPVGWYSGESVGDSPGERRGDG